MESKHKRSTSLSYETTIKSMQKFDPPGYEGLLKRLTSNTLKHTTNGWQLRESVRTPAMSTTETSVPYSTGQ